MDGGGCHRVRAERWVLHSHIRHQQHHRGTEKPWLYRQRRAYHGHHKRRRGGCRGLGRRARTGRNRTRWTNRTFRTGRPGRCHGTSRTSRHSGCHGSDWASGSAGRSRQPRSNGFDWTHRTAGNHGSRGSNRPHRAVRRQRRHVVLDHQRQLHATGCDEHSQRDHGEHGMDGRWNDRVCGHGGLLLRVVHHQRNRGRS